MIGNAAALDGVSSWQVVAGRSIKRSSWAGGHDFETQGCFKQARCIQPIGGCNIVADGAVSSAIRGVSGACFPCGKTRGTKRRIFFNLVTLGNI